MNSNTKNLKNYVSLTYRVVKPRTHVFYIVWLFITSVMLLSININWVPRMMSNVRIGH